MASDVMRRRIDQEADGREQRKNSPLGAGYYTPAVREAAAAVAEAMLRAALAGGVTLGDLDGVMDLATGALDATQSAARRVARNAQ